MPQPEDAELNLELLLDRLQPGDLQPLSLLLETYGSELYRLAFILLDRSGETNLAEAALELCAQTLRNALTNPKSFRGEENPKNWLFKSLMRTLQNRRRREVWILANKRHAPGKSQALQVSSEEKSIIVPKITPETRLLAVLDLFDDRARLVTCLSFIWKLDPGSLSEATGFSRRLILQNLKAVRMAVYDNLLQAGYEWAVPHTDHQALWGLMLDAMNGEDLLNPADRLQLRSHLESCPACRRHYSDLERLDGLVQQVLLSRWGGLGLDAEAASILMGKVSELMERREVGYHPPRLVRIAAQLALLLALFVGADWAISHITGVSNMPVEPTPEQSLRADDSHSWVSSPAIVESRSTPGSPAGLYIERFDFNIDPAISDDGHWIASAWTLANPKGNETSISVGGETISVKNKPTIGLTLHDIDRNNSTQILPAKPGTLLVENWPGGSSDANAVMHLVNGQITSPGLSSNGRWLVFALTQTVDKISWEMKPCISPDNGCGVILLYDRVNGSLHLASKGLDGGLPNGSVMQPSISGDGRRIIYWSNASNLVAGDTEECASIGDAPYNCWDLFIYDRVNDETERIPVGRRFEQLMWNDQMSLSFDAKFIALALHERDRIVYQMQINSPGVNVFVFDREGGRLLPVNSKKDGTPGNADSLLPAISADGHYVAFSTPSSNLDSADANGLFDVYLKDMFSREMKWVSHAANGGVVDSSSGLISVYDLVNARIAHLGVTIDGRYVIFLSTGGTLSTEGPAWCAIYGFGRCGNLYVHDMFTERTWPVFNDPQRAGSYISPRVSQQGRWVLAVYQFEDCSEPYGCAQVWLYDRMNPGIWQKFNIDASGMSGGQYEH